MRVTIIGVTGRIGKRVAARLSHNGHEVTGVNRRAARQAEVLGDLDIRLMVSDTNDPESLVRPLATAEVVVLATAPTRENPDAYLDQTRNVLHAASVAGVRRLIAVSNYKALLAPDGRPMLEAEPPNPYFRHLEETFTAQRDLVAGSDLDWLLVAPPADLQPYGPATGNWAIAIGQLVTTDPTRTDFAEVSRLSMDDLADLIVGEIENPRYSRQLISAAYA